MLKLFFGQFEPVLTVYCELTDQYKRELSGK